jgi:hypothetical protein
MALRASLACSLLAVLLGGCHYAGEPTSSCYVAPPDGTSQAALFRVSGAGECDTGGTSVTTVATPERTFLATIRFVVRGAAPGTTYLPQRSPEVGDHPLEADGICQRAEGLPPWMPSDGRFFSFVDPATGTPRTLTTNAKGDGSLEFEHRAASIAAGTTFDVEMRLVDNEAVPTTELRSGCMTVFVK